MKAGKGYLKKILASSVRMSTLIKDILNFSAVSDGSGFVATDLNIEMDNVLQDLELLIKQKEAVVEKTDLPVIECHSFTNKATVLQPCEQCPEIYSRWSNTTYKNLLPATGPKRIVQV